MRLKRMHLKRIHCSKTHRTNGTLQLGFTVHQISVTPNYGYTLLPFNMFKYLHLYNKCVTISKWSYEKHILQIYNWELAKLINQMFVHIQTSLKILNNDSFSHVLCVINKFICARLSNLFTIVVVILLRSDVVKYCWLGITPTL